MSVYHNGNLQREETLLQQQMQRSVTADKPCVGVRPLLSTRRKPLRLLERQRPLRLGTVLRTSYL